MKKPSLNFFLTVLIGLLLATSIILSFSSCTQTEIIDNIPNAEQTIVENTVQSGNWRISSFIDSGDDETYHFTNFTFTFNDDGTLIASNGSEFYEGTWSVTDSNSSNDDSPDDDLDFNIHFNLTNAFEELNDDWDIISRTDTRIELIDISGGNGGTDYLTFEKN